jgi:1,4-dihydroxy-2-naphthoate octaprenyltransferase
MNFIRLSTWKNKLAPFLCLIYACFYKYFNFTTKKEIEVVFFLLVGIILIAIWASLVNNYYDIEADTKAEKPNGMANISPFVRKLSLIISILSGLVYCYFLLPNKMAILFFGLGWLCFYSYSATAIRLKEKPFFDLVTDGLASQLFPALFVFSYLFESNFQKNSVFIFSGSLWLFFAMGVRALIMHQYRDEEKDRQAGLNTYLLGSKAEIRKKTEVFLLICEVLFFTVFAFSIHWIAFCLPIGLYGLFIFILKKYFANIKIVRFNLNVAGKHRIFLYDAYTLFIFCILGLLCWQNIQNSILVVFHLFLFHVAILVKLWQILKKTQKILIPLSQQHTEIMLSKKRHDNSC